MKDAPLSELVGKTLTLVENLDSSEIRFTTTDGDVYRLYHYQDCCESVRVEDITGDLGDLVGSPILMADKATSREWPADLKTPEYVDSFTWTFYKFGTLKGYVDIRFLGESNGYYSEGVDFLKDES